MKGKKMRDLGVIALLNAKAATFAAHKTRATPLPIWKEDLTRRTVVEYLVKAIPYVDKPEGFQLVGVISTNDDVESAVISNGGGRYYGRIAPDAIGVFVKEGAVPVFPTRL
jgi:hypothetical protein